MNNRTAFPLHPDLNATGMMGMTLREYYAAHAPSEIPGWFNGPQQEKPKRPEPPPSIEKQANDWFRDPCYDLEQSLPEEYCEIARQYEQAIKQWLKSCNEIDRENKIDRYFAWRWYYADMMLDWKQG